MSNITFDRQNGGLSRPLAGEDHISGLLVFSNFSPAGFDVPVKQIIDPEHAIALGIDPNNSDETVATGGAVLITAVGTVGNVSTITMDGVVLGTYTVLTDDIAEDIATGLRASINLGTENHGYIAGGTAKNVALTPPAGLGSSINGGTHLVYANTGTGTAAVTQFSGGEASFFDVVHYHISEFFRINSGAELHVGIYPIPQAYNFDEVESMQVATQGKLRKMAVYMKDVAFNTAHITALKSMRDKLDAKHMPVALMYGANIAAIDDLTTLPNLRALTGEGVMVSIGQDGAAAGKVLFDAKGYSITCIGAQLGALSRAKVHENIGWVGKFNMASVELDVPAFANGDLVTDETSSPANTLHNRGYVFLKKYVGDSGSYFNDDHACCPADSDFAFISNSIAMDKAVRGCYYKLLKQLNGPVYVDAKTGQLPADTVAYLESLAQGFLDQMERDGELSGAKFVINPNQDIQSTSVLNGSVGLVGVAVSRNIAVKIGYVKKLS
jgi:hypothetical protein